MPPQAVKQAREALGARLLEIRKAARLSGRALASQAGWHFTKISKIEHGTIMPSEDDLYLWCFHCHALAELPDLKAMRSNTEKMYIELRRLMKVGSSAYQQELKEREAESRTMRLFSSYLVPGALQTHAYATFRFTEFSAMTGVVPDVAEAVAARMERSSLLMSGRTLFHFVLCETVLTAAMAPPAIMLGQLRHLLETSKLPRVHLGVIPLGTPHYPPLCDFWIMDDRAAETETYTAFIRATQPLEVAMYAKVFDSLSRAALYGSEARAIIQRQVDILVQH